MNKLILTVLLVLVGCTGCVEDPSVNPPNIQFPDTLYIGDSNCDPVFNFWHTAQELAGVPFICEAGRLLVQVTPNQLYSRDSYARVVIALGVNDAAKHVNIDGYRSRLREFLTYDSAEYTCVLPYRTDSIDEEPYRQVMLEECTNRLDPEALGIQLTHDKVHWTVTGHNDFADDLIQYLEE